MILPTFAVSISTQRYTFFVDSMGKTLSEVLLKGMEYVDGEAKIINGVLKFPTYTDFDTAAQIYEGFSGNNFRSIEMKNQKEKVIARYSEEEINKHLELFLEEGSIGHILEYKLIAIDTTQGINEDAVAIVFRQKLVEQYRAIRREHKRK